MAARNLARTVIECGQHRQEQAARRLFRRQKRHLRFDAEGDAVGHDRRSGSKWFIDHLNPLVRWLDRQVGRGWRHVHREVCAMEDGRTLRGRHLREHVRGMVDDPPGPRSFGWFFVDRRGILRRGSPRRSQRPSQQFCEERRAIAWAAGRRVIAHGDVAFWTARGVDARSPVSAQGRRLTADEQSFFWGALSPGAREVVAYRPLRGPD
jgi:hypothetical protein